MSRLISNPAKRCRALTFDVGGTLIDPWPSVGHVYARVAADSGFPGLNPDRLTRQFIDAWQARGSFDYSRASWREMVVRSFAGLLDECQVHTFFESLFDQFGHPQAWRLYDDVVPAFRALRVQGYKLGVISNWDDRLPPLLQRLQLSEYLDGCIVSCVAGCAKPDAQIFHQAAEGLGLPPHQIVHVGDSEFEDVAGAAQAGLQPILIRRSPAKPPLQGCRVINTLTELIS